MRELNIRVFKRYTSKGSIGYVVASNDGSDTRCTAIPYAAEIVCSEIKKYHERTAGIDFSATIDFEPHHEIEWWKKLNGSGPLRNLPLNKEERDAFWQFFIADA